MPRPCRRPGSRSSMAWLMVSSSQAWVCRATLPCLGRLRDRGAARDHQSSSHYLGVHQAGRVRAAGSPVPQRSLPRTGQARYRPRAACASASDEPRSSMSTRSCKPRTAGSPACRYKQGHARRNVTSAATRASGATTRIAVRVGGGASERQRQLPRRPSRGRARARARRCQPGPYAAARGTVRLAGDHLTLTAPRR
jgi:hypothetical protein